MSTFESSYKSLLQGVSQQHPPERLSGQVTEQTNMVSDPVTGVRRRAGSVFRKHVVWPYTRPDAILAWFTGLVQARVHVMLNTLTGELKAFLEDFSEEFSFDGGAYLRTDTPSDIRAVTVGNSLYLANIGIKPTVNYAPVGPSPADSGFFYIAAGAFGKTYTVNVEYNNGNGLAVATYTTPSGAGAGDAALSTPEYIAVQLTLQLSASPLGGSQHIDGQYVYFNRPNGIKITTNVGTAYMTVSNNMNVPNVGSLPARLPAAAHQATVRVGSGGAAQYYQYNHPNTEWLESSEWGSPSSITNAPVRIGWTGSAVFVDSTPFEGRLAGDDTTNALHAWMVDGITGIGTHQGRLVLMSGPMVSLSASDNPRRFFRSTVTNVISSDPIEIGSSMLSAASYEWAVPFNKDLLLFSKSYQAVIPSGNQAVTPQTATVLPTSSHEVDVSCCPVSLGRTLMYPAPRSTGYFGVMEMIPSNATDSQYTSQDSTPHLPRYFQGKCRFATTSGSSNIAVFAPVDTPNDLIVHEYQWSGDEKVQQAWHRWTFPYPVAYGYFAADVLTIVFAQNGQVVLCTLDPRAGSYGARGLSPLVDFSFPTTIVSNVVQIPDWLYNFDPLVAGKLALQVRSGDLAGDRVGFTPQVDWHSLTTVPSYPSEQVFVGLPYRSSFTPSPPVVTDYQQNVIHTGKATLLRFLVGTKNSDEFNVIVHDGRGDPEELEVPTLAWTSSELELGRGKFSNDAMSIVPCRTNMRTTDMEIWTDGVGELNVSALEYVGKYHAKITRKG